MVTKIKKSVSLSVSLLDELAIHNRNGNISEFIENAIAYYLNELKRQERRKRDMKIIAANAKRYKKEAEENLRFQALI